MSISSRITSIEEHIKESYQELEGLGIDTTGVDKNLENIPKLIDGYWETLPKVTGEGTAITLDNTKEGKMKIDLKGNTSQETTTGKNLFNSIYYKNKKIYTETISISTGNLYCTKLYLKPNTTYTISEALNNWSLDGGWIFVVADTNNQIIRFLQNRQRDYQTTPTTFTTNSEGYVYIGHRYGFVEGTTDRILTFLDTVNIQIEEGNTATSFEEYTGGPSPNPDYPQDIHVVSGDNIVKVEGKNLNNVLYSDIHLLPNWDGTITTHNSYNSVIVDTRNVDSIYVSGDFSVIESGGIRAGKCNDYPSASTTGTRFSFPSSSAVNTTNVNYVLLSFQPASGKTFTDIQNSIQIEYGSTATEYEEYKGASYPINLGNIELCKIGDYQDSIKKSTGKNLFNGETEMGAYNTTTGAKRQNNSTRRNVNFINVLPNTTYTLSRNGSTFNCRYMYYDKNKAYINTEVVNGSISTPANCYYLNFYSDQLVSNYSNLQLELGNTATSYEPYGKVWYLNKQIGKVVLNGSETINKSGASTTNTQMFLVSINGIITNVGNGILSDKFKTNINIWTYDEEGIRGNSLYTTNTCWIRINKNRLTDNTVQSFKVWLSSNNIIVYYVLATPTTTEITDSTLLSQLEALNGAKSYNPQTNVSQENNDNASVLNATALSE